MIDAVMYGMMPSAKIVICDRLPPENMSYRPNIVFSRLFGQQRQRLRCSRPGVGMWPPMR